MKQNHICVQYKIIFSNIRVVVAPNRLRFVLKFMDMYCKTLYALWENFCFEKLTQSAVDVTWTLWRKRPIKCIFSCKYLTCILWKPVSQKLVFPCVLYYDSHCDYCVLVQLLLKMCPGGWEVWVALWIYKLNYGILGLEDEIWHVIFWRDWIRYWVDKWPICTGLTVCLGHVCVLVHYRRKNSKNVQEFQSITVS